MFLGLTGEATVDYNVTDGGGFLKHKSDNICDEDRIKMRIVKVTEP
jgi:hypothetical protein